jgi:hypothetical protein
MRHPPQLGQIALVTRKGDEPLEPTCVAPDPREAPLELAASEEVAELALDEARQAHAVRCGGRLRQEAVEVEAHDVVEHRRGRRPRLVDPRRHDGAQRIPCRGGASRRREGTTVDRDYPRQVSDSVRAT